MTALTNLPGLPMNAPLPAAVQAAMAQSSMDGFGDGFAATRRVQTKGGMINFLAEDGKPMGTVMSEAGTTVTFPQYTNSARIIIVGMSPAGGDVYRTWYGKSYTEGDTSPPDCWSPDGKHPSAKASNPQSDACATCAKNVAGTSATGKGKACSSRKKLAVVFADDPELRVFGVDLPSTALFGKSAREAEGFYTLSAYAKMLKGHNVPWEYVITEMSFAEGSTKGVQFKAVGYTDEQTFTRILSWRDHDDTKRALEVDFPAATDKADTPAANAYAAPALPTPTGVDPKTAALANPAFTTTLAHMKDWASHPAVTYDMVKTEAAKFGVAL